MTQLQFNSIQPNITNKINKLLFKGPCGLGYRYVELNYCSDAKRM